MIHEPQKMNTCRTADSQQMIHMSTVNLELEEQFFTQAADKHLQLGVILVRFCSVQHHTSADAYHTACKHFHHAQTRFRESKELACQSSISKSSESQHQNCTLPLSSLRQCMFWCRKLYIFYTYIYSQSKNTTYTLQMNFKD